MADKIEEESETQDPPWWLKTVKRDMEREVYKACDKEDMLMEVMNATNKS